jgi:hypothetical protein
VFRFDDDDSKLGYNNFKPLFNRRKTIRFDIHSVFVNRITRLLRIASDRKFYESGATACMLHCFRPLDWLISGPTSFGNEGLQPAVSRRVSRDSEKQAEESAEEKKINENLIDRFEKKTTRLRLSQCRFSSTSRLFTFIVNTRLRFSFFIFFQQTLSLQYIAR